MSVIDLRSQKQQVGEDPADNIIKIINAAAQAKQSKLKLEQELMLDDIKRQRDLRDKGLEQQQTQQNETAGFERMFGGGMADAGTPKEVAQNPWQATQPQVSEQPQGMNIPNEYGGGQVQPQIQQQSQPAMVDGFQMPDPRTILASKKGKLDFKDITYANIYKKVASGTASESEQKWAKDYLGMQDKKPPTAGQETTALYASRIKQANEVFDKLEKFTHNQNAVDYVQAGLPEWANVLKGGDMQSYQQAQRNFVNAVLRRESGAVISPSEFDNARQQYFPQPGDKPEVLAQKKANRELVMQNFIKSSGDAYVPYESTSQSVSKTDGWTPEKESRYQELLKKRESK